MRLMILLSVFSLVACSNLPKKPSVELCVVDYDRQEASCAMTDGEDVMRLGGFTYENVAYAVYSSPTATRYPLIYLNKAIAFRPDSFATLEKYLHDLERYAKEKCEP